MCMRASTHDALSSRGVQDVSGAVLSLVIKMEKKKRRKRKKEKKRISFSFFNE